MIRRTSASVNMSVDVFGRALKKSEALILRNYSEDIIKLKGDIDNLTSLLFKLKEEIGNEVEKKVKELTDLVEAHRDEIDQQILLLNSRYWTLKEGHNE